MRLLGGYAEVPAPNDVSLVLLLVPPEQISDSESDDEGDVQRYRKGEEPVVVAKKTAAES